MKTELQMVSGKTQDMSFNELPEECIANILSFTSPKDAGQLSVVSPMFRSASESDFVWERFLPIDHKSIISNSNSSLLLETVTSKKQLYLNLYDNPILVDNGEKSFWLEKRTGKICYMLSARDLIITGGDTPRYWAGLLILRPDLQMWLSFLMCVGLKSVAKSVLVFYPQQQCIQHTLFTISPQKLMDWMTSQLRLQ